MPFRCEGSFGCPECVGGLLGPPDDAVRALGGVKLARNRQNASISLVESPGQKIPPKSRLGPSHGVHLREAALSSHGRRACRLVPGRSRWTSRTNGRPLRCFGCGNWPSRRRRGCPSNDSHWRQDFECLHGGPSAASRPAVRRQRPPSSSLATPLRYQPHCDPSHHQWFAQCPRTARIAWAVIEWHPGRRTSCQGCCRAAQRGLTDPRTRPDARTRSSSSLHVAY